MAPNLGLTRNKNRAVPVTPKIVIKSDTENSESEADEIIKHNDPCSPVENVSENPSSDQVTAPVEPPVRQNGVYDEVIASKPTNIPAAVTPEAVETVEITPLVNGDKPDTTDSAPAVVNVGKEAKTQEC